MIARLAELPQFSRIPKRVAWPKAHETVIYITLLAASPAKIQQFRAVPARLPWMRISADVNHTPMW